MIENEIEYFKFEMVPEHHANTTQRTMNIKIVCNGEEYHIRKPVFSDDLVSFAHVYFHEAKNSFISQVTDRTRERHDQASNI